MLVLRSNERSTSKFQAASEAAQRQMSLTDEYSVFPYRHVRIPCGYEKILCWLRLKQTNAHGVYWVVILTNN